MSEALDDDLASSLPGRPRATSRCDLGWPDLPERFAPSRLSPSNKLLTLPLGAGFTLHAWDETAS
jgi:hypothetical protein